MPRNDNAIATLAKSEKPRELVRAAQELAASSDPEDHAALLKVLRDPGFRARLDPPGEETTGGTDLNLARPIRTLASSRAAVAKDTLRQLFSDAAFKEDPDRMDMLLVATETWRPAEPAVVAFWRSAVEPDGLHTETAIVVAAQNASEPAVAFFEDCLRDGRFEEDLRTGWMREHLPIHRNEEGFLRMAERLLAQDGPAALSPPLKFALLEALFDFKQEEWYPPHSPPRPPPRAATPRPVRDIYRRLAILARERFDPDEALEPAIVAVLTQFDALDRSKPK